MGCAQYTPITMKSVILNSHVKMSVKPAKDVFSHKTINEQLTNLTKRIRCCNEILLRNKLHSTIEIQSHQSNHFTKKLQIIKAIMNDGAFAPEETTITC